MPKRRISILLLASTLVAAILWSTLPLPAIAAPVTPAPTPLATVSATEVARTAPPLSLTLTLAFTCCALAAVLGVLVLGFVMGIQRRKDGKPDKEL